MGAKDEGGHPEVRKGPEREMVGGDLKYLQRLTSLTIDETGSAPPPPHALAEVSVHTFHIPSPLPVE